MHNDIIKNIEHIHSTHYLPKYIVGIKYFYADVGENRMGMYFSKFYRKVGTYVSFVGYYSI